MYRLVHVFYESESGPKLDMVFMELTISSSTLQQQRKIKILCELFLYIEDPLLQYLIETMSDVAVDNVCL
jgi:hypothetical protein